MTVWLVRAGQHGEREEFALEKGVAVIGWDQLPDMTSCSTPEELRKSYIETYPDAKPRKISNHVGQLWAFRERLQEGDTVVLPLKTRSAIAFGQVKGPYCYRPDFPADARHTRDVKWIRTDVPKTDIGRDLLFSFGAFMTVCRISRANAEQRIAAIVAGNRDPNLASPPVIQSTDDAAQDDVDDIPQRIDVEAFAMDQIRDRILAQFSGHGFGRLMAAVLKAQGYQVRESTPGADGGVDIVAGGGLMGFDSPRLCVQVKSQMSPVDVGVLRELQGVMKNYGAEFGLLFSWGGFKDSVYKEARTLYFEIRLWDADRFINALFDVYDRLPEDIQTEIPLKRVWILVNDD